MRTVLVTRYLINFYAGLLSLNPVVREISLAHLREEPEVFRQAHSVAAEYHLRHFQAKRIVGSQTKLGESFAELRYHLVQAKREEELSLIGRRFTGHLKRELSLVSPVPKDREELDERIGVLTALLGDGGAKGLEYHLARCLRERGRPEDIRQGVIHAERALGLGASDKTWVLLAHLTLQANGPEAATKVIRRGLRILPQANELYQIGANIMVGAGKTDEAVTLLKDGIKVVPPDKSLASLYQICADLLDKAGKTDEAVTLLKAGIKVIPPQYSLFSLYQICAELLAGAGKTEEAITLLKDGIKVIPPQYNLASLYQICAELLAKAGKTDEAVTLLKDGIKVIPPQYNLFSLYQICAELLGKAGKTDEAVTLLKAGIKVIPPQYNLFSLYQLLSELYCRDSAITDAIACLREGFDRIPEKFIRYKLAESMVYLCAASGDANTLAEILTAKGGQAIGSQQDALGTVFQRELQDDWPGAAEVASTARSEFPGYLPLTTSDAFCHLAAGDVEGAWRALSSFPNLILDTGSPTGWLVAFIHLRRGSRSEACSALATYLGRPVYEAPELNEAFLLRLWDQQEIVPEGHRLCYHFPVMPGSLSGLGHTVRRIQFSKPVLPLQLPPMVPIVGDSVAASPAEMPQIYVSYAWGEDSTEADRQREEIVDRLCEAVKASGRTIGRDKDRLKGGGSIERFARELSKAERIVAVISEKSLHSEFCMAHELFRAYRRCDYRRDEFQEKVIALVMDDAKAIMKDHSALIGLAGEWKDKLGKRHDELHAVDPNRKSSDLWIFVDMMEEMCPRLPGMLDALRDIVMKRGFEEIMADGFREVISLLPVSKAAS